MKRVFIFIALVSLATSCCKIDLVVGLHVSYPNLDHESELIVTSYQKETYLLIDTIFQGTLAASNDYSHFIPFDDDGASNYLFEVDSTYSDFIENFKYDTKGFNCNVRVGEVDYIHNGVQREEMELVIH